jgi:hypothetical protein
MQFIVHFQFATGTDDRKDVFFYQVRQVSKSICRANGSFQLARMLTVLSILCTLGR